MRKCNLLYFIFSILISQSGLAAIYSFSGEMWYLGRGLNTNSNQNSDHNADLLLEQKIKYTNQISALFQLKAFINNSYLSNASNYDVYDYKKQSSEVYGGENYFQYKVPGKLLRIGYQQISWGEAFGLFYSDFINAKDLRRGLFTSGSLSKRSSFLMNWKWMGEDWGVQALVSPENPHHILQMPSRILGMRNLRLLGASSVQMREAQNKGLAGDPEYGVRFSKNVSGSDFGIYYYNYSDRMPYFSTTNGGALGSSIDLTSNYKKVSSYGMTLASSVYDYILRAELMKTNGRKFNTLNLLSLSSIERDEVVSVIGVESPSIWSTVFSIQYSDSNLNQGASGLFRDIYQSTYSLRARYDLGNDKAFELNYVYSAYDFGSLVRGEYIFPNGKNLEIKVGGEVYSGPEQSDFGRNQDLNHFFLEFHSFFKGS